MKLKDMIDNLIEIDPETYSELKKSHPMQWLSEYIKIPVWRIEYEYTTVRNNRKKYYKYLVEDELAWDGIDPEFDYWLEEFNERNPERKLSNVEILDAKFLGRFLLPIK